jgi:hypothetical protein
MKTRDRVDQAFGIGSHGFRLRVKTDTFEVWLGGVPYFELSVRSGVDRDPAATDVDEPVLRRTSGVRNGRRWFEWTTRSSLWERKRYRLEIYKGAFTYRVFVQGRGALGTVAYFSGSGVAETPGSRYEVGRYLAPSPSHGASTLPWPHPANEDGTLFFHYLQPPLFAFPFALSAEGAPWLALGLAPRPGHYNFDRFHYRASTGHARTRCHFATDYLGYTVVNGEYEMAAIVGTAGADAFGALDRHAAWLYDHGGCRRGDWSQTPDWWHGPLFCGWGEQGNLRPGDPYPSAAATQTAYQTMSDRLDTLGLEPTAIIIDDKWMGRYGVALPDVDKWPDLRGFVEAQHRKGRRVVLWFKSWNTEGLPVEECVTLWHQPMGADPNAPAYRRRIRALMRRLLGNGPGDFNADGFKLDFNNVMPLGRDLAGTRRTYGIELLKDLLTLLYTEAKAVKPDCLINNSCGHPYFAEVTDQCRLHDYDSRMRSAWEVMSYRQRLFRAAMPGVPIDTDGFASTRRETLDYLLRSAELGAPDLYCLTRFGDWEPTRAEWAQIRRHWQAYRNHRAGADKS